MATTSGPGNARSGPRAGRPTLDTLHRPRSRARSARGFHRPVRRWGSIAGRGCLPCPSAAWAAGASLPLLGGDREEETPTVVPEREREQSAVAGISRSPCGTMPPCRMRGISRSSRPCRRRVGPRTRTSARRWVSASAVHERVRKLEHQGVIRGYRAVVDPESVGLYVTALIAAIPLDPHQPDDLPARVREFPEVEDCYSVAGEANYVLKVRTKTTGDLEDRIRRLREKAAVTTNTDDRAFDPVRRPPVEHLIQVPSPGCRYVIGLVPRASRGIMMRCSRGFPIAPRSEAWSDSSWCCWPLPVPRLGTSTSATRRPGRPSDPTSGPCSRSPRCRGSTRPPTPRTRSTGWSGSTPTRSRTSRTSTHRPSRPTSLRASRRSSRSPGNPGTWRAFRCCGTS